MVNNQNKQRILQRQPGASLPLEDYDSLSAKEIVKRSTQLSPTQIEQLCHYERVNKNRKYLTRYFQHRIGALAATSATGRADPPPGEKRPQKRK